MSVWHIQNASIIMVQQIGGLSKLISRQKNWLMVKEARAMENDFIRQLRSNDPAIGYNRSPRHSETRGIVARPADMPERPLMSLG
jgi:hypothetical protein